MTACNNRENILKKCMQLENGYMHFLHAYGVALQKYAFKKGAKYGKIRHLEKEIRYSYEQ